MVSSIDLSTSRSLRWRSPKSPGPAATGTEPALSATLVFANPVPAFTRDRASLTPPPDSPRHPSPPPIDAPMDGLVGAPFGVPMPDSHPASPHPVTHDSQTVSPDPQTSPTISESHLSAKSTQDPTPTPPDSPRHLSPPPPDSPRHPSPPPPAPTELRVASPIGEHSPLPRSHASTEPDRHASTQSRLGSQPPFALSETQTRAVQTQSPLIDAWRKSTLQGIQPTSSLSNTVIQSMIDRTQTRLNQLPTGRDPATHYRLSTRFGHLTHLLNLVNNNKIQVHAVLGWGPDATGSPPPHLSISEYDSLVISTKDHPLPFIMSLGSNAQHHANLISPPTTPTTLSRPDSPQDPPTSSPLPPITDLPAMLDSPNPLEGDPSLLQFLTTVGTLIISRQPDGPVPVNWDPRPMPPGDPTPISSDSPPPTDEHWIVIPYTQPDPQSDASEMDR